MSLLTLPLSTMRTTSMVSSVVTRRPAVNIDSMPEPLEVVGDLRAAAVHDHRAQPGVAQEHEVFREPGPQFRWRSSRGRRT